MTNYIIDTREQRPLLNGIRKVLRTGDYSIEGYEDIIAIERKSVSDLFNTLTGGHERFKREIGRSFGLQYFAVVVEGDVSTILDKSFAGAEHTRMKGDTILKILFTIHHKYNIPVFLCAGRVEARRVTKYLLDSFIKIHTSNKKQKI